MDSALIVSHSEKGVDFFENMLHSIACNKIVTVKTCGEARRLVLERDFDICIINSPLSDESGENLSKDIVSNGQCQVMLIVKNEFYEVISDKVEDLGVVTIAKPINRAIFWTALKMIKASYNRMNRMKAENSKLTQKIDDIRIIDRAKCILISHLSMTEPEAHKYIERQAMDKRVSKRKIAEDILKTYEN